MEEEATGCVRADAPSPANNKLPPLWSLFPRQDEKCGPEDRGRGEIEFTSLLAPGGSGAASRAARSRRWARSAASSGASMRTSLYTMCGGGGGVSVSVCTCDSSAPNHCCTTVLATCIQPQPQAPHTQQSGEIWCVTPSGEVVNTSHRHHSVGGNRVKMQEKLCNLS